ncbi:MAG: helix-turn-helix domain-containing protein [Pseudomonadota bacterium]
MAMIGKVRRMFFREKKSVREIVRLTSLSRNTVRKWLKALALGGIGMTRRQKVR